MVIYFLLFPDQLVAGNPETPCRLGLISPTHLQGVFDNLPLDVIGDPLRHLSKINSLRGELGQDVVDLNPADALDW